MSDATIDKYGFGDRLLAYLHIIRSRDIIKRTFRVGIRETARNYNLPYTTVSRIFDHARRELKWITNGSPMDHQSQQTSGTDGGVWITNGSPADHPALPDRASTDENSPLKTFKEVKENILTTPPFTPPPGVEYPDWLNLEAWDEFKLHRKSLKPKLTELAERKALNILKALVEAGEDQVAVIDQTIANGWKSFFPEKGRAGSFQSQEPEPASVMRFKDHFGGSKDGQ